MVVRNSARITSAIAVLVLAILSGGPAMAAGKKKAVPSSASSPSPAASWSPTPGFTIKPSEVAVPDGVALGKYRRTFQPFQNWTLVCDENLAKKQKICNIAQTILGPDGTTVFSWSLAASQDGQPLFILRVPSAVGADGTISLALPDNGPAVSVKVQGCTATVCLAYQPAGQRLRSAVGKALTIEVSYAGGSPPTKVAFRAPLAGLSDALAAI